MSEERKVLQRRGSFTCASRAAEICGTVSLSSLIFAAAVLVLCLLDFGGAVGGALWAILFVCLGAFAAGLIARLVLGSGQGCEFEARETDFEVRGPRAQHEIFYYSDVADVMYVPFYRKERLRGYAVTITTGIRTVRYRFIFSPNAELLDTEHTPFYYLEVNSGLREEEQLTVNADAVLSQFESRQREHKKKKSTRAERAQDFFNSIAKGDE